MKHQLLLFLHMMHLLVEDQKNEISDSDLQSEHKQTQQLCYFSEGKKYFKVLRSD